MAGELKPIPPHDFQSDPYTSKCGYCGLGRSRHNEAIAAWNRRPSPAPEAGGVEPVAWPPLKLALWHVIMDENLNDGHYIKARELTEKLYCAALATPQPAQVSATPPDEGLCGRCEYPEDECRCGPPREGEPPYQAAVDMGAPQPAQVSLFDLMEENCWDLRCIAIPIADTGDADIDWVVIEHHMAKPHEREVGRGSTPVKALQSSRKAG
jgi:hypothetical protein